MNWFTVHKTLLNTLWKRYGRYGKCAPLPHPRASACICIAVGSSCYHVYNVKTYSCHICLLELLCARLERPGPASCALAQWIRPQWTRMHFNLSATEPAPPTTLPSVLNISTQMSQSTTASQEKGDKDKYYQIPPLLPSVFASAQEVHRFHSHFANTGKCVVEEALTSEACRHWFSIKGKVVRQVV